MRLKRPYSTDPRSTGCDGEGELTCQEWMESTMRLHPN
jgi:hypothetical protein